MRKITLVLLVMFFFSHVKAQTPLKGIDVQHYTFNIGLNDQNDTIKGKAIVSIKFLADVNDFQLNLVKTNSKGKGMTVSEVLADGRRTTFSQDSGLVNVHSPAKAGTVHSYTITYSGVPADGLIISKNEFGHRTFFGDNWPNRAHNWLPCADYPADKATVDFIVTAPDHYQVVSNGAKIEERPLTNHVKLTHWKESTPLPTKVMVIGVADFAIDRVGDVGKIPVYTYVFPERKEAGFKNYAIAKEILPYYIKMFGPFAYEKLANVESKTIFGGMENASAIFYFEDSPTDKGIESLMAHEIAHQWFGDAASEKSFVHLWLSEGFATYMTNVYLEHKYGEDTLKKELIKDRALVFRFEKRRMTPVVDSTVKGNYMQLLNANSYQKGGWVLHMLRKKLGDTVFWKGIRAYYAEYDGSNANTEDFRTVMEKISGQNLQQFFKQWLYTAGHPKIRINWKMAADGKQVSVMVTQQQALPYEFPLNIDIDGDIHHIDIKSQMTGVTFPVKAATPVITADPDVNLLAEFEVRAL